MCILELIWNFQYVAKLFDKNKIKLKLFQLYKQKNKKTREISNLGQCLADMQSTTVILKPVREDTEVKEEEAVVKSVSYWKKSDYKLAPYQNHRHERSLQNILPELPVR